MSNELVTLRFPNLTPLERIELQERLSQGTVTFEEQTIDEGFAGEPITVTAVILLSTLSLKGIVSWLLKNRLSKQFEKTVEILRKDGTVVRTTVKVNLKSSTAAADILKQLGTSDDMMKEVLNSLGGSNG